jgi:translation initiation factor 3 subunit H
MAEGGINFAAMAGKEKGDQPLRSVQIDGQVLLKVLKHCKECMPSLVTGQLLGLDIGSTLEVTNAFPFPSESEDGGEADGAGYQLEMMRCLREVNVDNNTVGWYQSTYLGSYQTVELIETFLNYQENIKRCVCLVYDPYRSSQGVLALKALKLTSSFMDVYRNGQVTAEALSKSAISWQDIFEEIPISISNSTLHSVLMQELETDQAANQADFDRLVLSTNPYLEKNLEFLSECIDDLQQEQQKISFFNRNAARQQQQQAQWLQKRRAENFQRRAAGEEPLPEEDPNNPIFKALVEPSKLDSLLITNQINNYCNQINQFAGQGMEKMYLMQGLHQDN